MARPIKKQFIEYYDISELPVGKISIESGDYKGSLIYDSKTAQWEFDSAEINGKKPMEHLNDYLNHPNVQRTDSEIVFSIYGVPKSDSLARSYRNDLAKVCPPFRDCFVYDYVEHDALTDNRWGFYLIKNDRICFRFYDMESERELKNVPVKNRKFTNFTPTILRKRSIKQPSVERTIANGADREGLNLYLNCKALHAYHANGDPTVLEIMQQGQDYVEAAFDTTETDCVWAMLCCKEFGSLKAKAILSFTAEMPEEIKSVHIEIKPENKEDLKLIHKFLPGRQEYTVEIQNDEPLYVRELCFTFYFKRDIARNTSGTFRIEHISLK